MNDRELLKLAARATPGIADGDVLYDMRRESVWKPLTDDGDALRLAVALKLSVKHGIEIWDDTHSMSAYAYYGDVGECQFEPHGDNPFAATRRAIVRAAAAIGETMP